MMSKTSQTLLMALLSLAVLALAFGSGYTLGTRHLSDTGQDLAEVNQAWQFLLHDYVDKTKLDTTKLSQAAIKGMVEALDDPYTAYLDTETYQLGMSSMEGKFDGIGAHIAIKDEQLVIIAPIADSPAAKAGIRAGDIILEIDGQPTTGISLTEAVLKIRGTRGTPVKLLIHHQDQPEPEEIEIIRGEIKLTSVHWEMQGDIADIRITHFSEGTAQEMAPALEAVTRQGATGIILDLRSNPGGLLQTVVDVASYFIPQDVVVKVVDNEGRETVLTAGTQPVTTDLPIVILVDEFSASGSEVLAGALRDNGRAVIAGTVTYGKGSVNVIHQLMDGSGLAITTARWLTPSGHLIEGKGLTPDYEIDPEGEEAINWALDYLKKA